MLKRLISFIKLLFISYVRTPIVPYHPPVPPIEPTKVVVRIVKPEKKKSAPKKRKSK